MVLHSQPSFPLLSGIGEFFLFKVFLHTLMVNIETRLCFVLPSLSKMETPSVSGVVNQASLG
jgi:hypothetical protein